MSDFLFLVHDLMAPATLPFLFKVWCTRSHTSAKTENSLDTYIYAARLESLGTR